MYSEMRKRKIFRASNLCIVLLIALSFILPPEAFAARRRAGGGELAHFDFGNYAAGIGIGVGAMAVGGVINAGLSSALGNVTSVGKGVLTGSAIPSITTQSSNILTAMGNSLSYSFTTTGLITNMSTFMAVSQVGRAVGAAGSYYGWKPSTTFLVSSFASGAVGGFMNPSVALGPSVSEGITNSIIPGVHYTLNPANYTLGNMLNGAFVGGVTGLASGAVIVGIDGNKINEGKQPGVGAQIAGMVTGVAVGNLTRTLIDPRTYHTKDLGDWKEVDHPKIEKYNNLANASTEKAQESFGKAAEPLAHALGRVGEASGNLIKGDYSGAVDNIKAMGEKMGWGDVKSAGKNLWDGLGSMAEAKQYAQSVQDIKGMEGPVVYREVLTYTPRGEERLGQNYYTHSQLQNRFELGGQNAQIRLDPITDQAYFHATQTNAQLSLGEVGLKLFDATFIDTARMWPMLVTKSLSIAAVSSLGKKQRWMAPLVGAAVEGVAGPLFNNLKEVYALDPGLYVGRNHIASSIAYVEHMNKLIYMHNMGRISEKLSDVYKQAKVTDMELGQFGNKLQDVLKKEGIEVAGLNLGGITKKEDVLPLLEQKIKENVENKLISTKEADIQLTELRNGFDTLNAKRAVLNLAVAQADPIVRGRLNAVKETGGTLDQAFQAGRTSRTSIFLTNTTQEMTYGLVEGLVSGGIASLANKVAQNNPLAAAGVAYGGAMLAGTVRGIILHATWKPSKVGEDLVWMDRSNQYKPESYKPDPADGYNWVHRKLRETTYKTELTDFNEFGRLTGLPLAKREKSIYDWTAKGAERVMEKTKTEQIKGYELMLGQVYSETERKYVELRPSLEISILKSLKETNNEFLKNAFSFGAPLKSNPKYITTPEMANYMSSLRGYAMTAMQADLRYIPSPHVNKDKNIGFHQSYASIKDKFSSPRKFFGLKPKHEKEPLSGWLVPGIISEYIDAGAFATGVNVLGSMAAVKPVANFFNIQQQRLIFTNANRPDPLAIQNLDYEAWLTTRKTRFSFDYFRTISRSGKSYLTNR